MPFRRRLLYSLMAALLITGLMYWIDSDPPYPNRLHTLAEFAIITGTLLAVFLGIPYLFRKKDK